MNMTFEQMLNENLKKVPEPEVFKIDGQLTQGHLMTIEDFIKTFYELETLLQSDCKQLVDRATLDEEDEEIISIEEYSYRDCLEKFNQFTTNFMHYVLFNKYADEDNFRVWKKLRTWIDTPDEDICEDNKICLIKYLEEYWKAWLESIIDETYSYMYCTRIVWEAWEEFCS